MKSTAKKCIKPFDPDAINFLIAPFSLGNHWTGDVATCHKNDLIFNKGPMWIIIHMYSMHETYDDDEYDHMNVFLEYLHHLI